MRFILSPHTFRHSFSLSLCTKPNFFAILRISLRHACLMLLVAFSGASSISVSTVTFVVPTISTSSSSTTGKFVRLRTRAFLNKPSTSLQQNTKQTPHVVYESLRILEWDKVCDSIASFADTSLGKQATKEQLWSLNQSYEQSIGLLEEANAAVEMHKYGAIMDFSGIDFELVSS